MNSNGDAEDLASSLGVQHLLNCLEQINVKVGGSDLDLLFLKNLLRSEDVQALLRIHEKVATPEVRNNKPLVDSADDLLSQVVESLDCTSCTPGGIELLQILMEPHFRGFIEAHDGIAKRHYQPQLISLPYEVDEDEEAVKIVCLVKGPTEPLGATIHQDRKTGTIKVARIMHGGVADRSGLIMEGDEIHEVNGKRVTGKPPDEVISILSCAVGNVTLKLIPADLDNGLCRDTKVRVRAHFDYNPRDDKLIPCKEAGLSFRRGDILHIVSQDDATWWQARIEGGGRTRAGLIPGRQLQERRETMKLSPVSPESPSTKDREQKGHRMGGMFSPKSLVRRTRRVKRIVSCGQLAEDTEPEDSVAPYEEVSQYYPKSGVYRPIILVGPTGVGRKTLVQRLMLLRSRHFKAPVIMTSRPKKVTEVSGETYTFVARDEMERDIYNNRYVDHFEYGGHLYATSMGQIISVVNEGKVCILCPQPQALKQLHVAELKPYVISIKPPAFDKLKQSRNASNAKLSPGGVWSQNFQDDDFREMLQSADKIEATCSHFFDSVIINDNLQETVEELCHIADRLELEPSWMPSVWLH